MTLFKASTSAPAPCERGLLPGCSRIGTGRLIFSLNYTEADFETVADRFVAAARAMQGDGWWWREPNATNKSIRRRILREIVAHRLSGRRGAATQFMGS